MYVSNASLLAPGRAADIASELSLDADPTSALPGALGITAEDLGGGLGSDLDGVLSGPGDGSGGIGSALENAGKGEARCFGTTGTGKRFVYVFDRSVISVTVACKDHIGFFTDIGKSFNGAVGEGVKDHASVLGVQPEAGMSKPCHFHKLTSFSSILRESRAPRRDPL